MMLSVTPRQKQAATIHKWVDIYNLILVFLYDVDNERDFFLKLSLVCFWEQYD